MASVPMFAPDGTLGDIPPEKLHDALAAGFKQGVTMKSPDGKLGVVPADRMPDAAKGGLVPVPLAEQETQHQGFWKSLGGDLAGMVKGVPSMVANATPLGEVYQDVAHYGEREKNLAQHAADQKKQGYSMPYRALTPVAENLGVNVRGMEDSAKEGDAAGVAGHAAAVPAAMAATEGVAKAAPVISDVAQAAAQKASRAADMVRDVTPKQAARVGGGAVTAGTLTAAGHPIAAIPAATLAAERMGRVAEIVLGKDRANAPIFSRAPELSLDNITDALAQTIAADRARFTEMQAKGLGEIPATGAKPAAQSGEALATNPTSIGPEPPKGGKAAPKFSAADRAAAQSLLQDALQHGTGDVVDAAISKDNRGVNLHAKAQVEFYLKRGDVGGAEQALDTAAKQANPSYTPPSRNLTLKELAEKYEDKAANEPISNGPVSSNGHTWEYKSGNFLKDGNVLDKSDDIADALAALSQKDYFGGKTIEGQVVQSRPANPAWQPPQRQIVPSTNEIRARVQSQAASASKADQLDTRALQQEMAQDLQKHGWSAESEARREFIARNSNEFNKSGKSRGYVEGESVKYTKTPGVNVSGKSAPAPAVASDDLTDLLQKSLDEARQRQQGK